MTENEEALSDLRAKHEKKRKVEEKKKGGKRLQLPRPLPEEESEAEAEEMVLDDSSEYSDEMPNDPLDALDAYPFKDKQPEVRN